MPLSMFDHTHTAKGPKKFGSLMICTDYSDGRRDPAFFSLNNGSEAALPIGRTWHIYGPELSMELSPPIPAVISCARSIDPEFPRIIP